MHPTIRINNKKGLLTSVVSLMLAVAPLGASANIPSAYEPEQIQAAEIIMQEEAPEIKEDHTPLALQEPEVFTSDYGESKIARKMTQAEKSRNAAENDGWGGAITIIAMCIVLAALIVLSILFMIFGKVSELILTSRKKKAKAAADHSPHDDHELAPGEVIAAISLALAEYFSDPHDLEDTHLTIRRLQKAYSPWNSKIYNLRQNQDHRRNPSTEINFNESKRIQI
ncbi:MAG: OadG family protein [Muribaculaceae bacterium]|nr:OadG family protein [Muribaculaceae bacterium]